MSIKKISKEQPDTFEFTESNLKLSEDIISKYPDGKEQSAVMSMLYLVQKQNENWIPLVAMKYVAKLLNMPYIKVYEVATFYSMYNLTPVGKFFYQVCTTTPCMLRGANKLLDACKEKISKNQNEISEDGNSSWVEVECLGACVNAPMVQINENYYEDLDKDKLTKIINETTKGQQPKPGSYKGRLNSAPEIKRTTLNNL